jgi:hypothetical protein
MKEGLKKLLEVEYGHIISGNKEPTAHFHTVDISGFNGAYELCCQWLLWNAFLKIRTGPIHTPDTTEAINYWLSRQRWIDKAEPSGHQIRSVSSYLSYLLKYGYIQWIEHVHDKDPERVYTINWRLLDCFEKCYLR